MQSVLPKNVLLAIVLSAAIPVHAAILSVGHGKSYATIKDAYTKASSGDTIFVYPAENDEPYRQTALTIRKSDISIIGRGTKSKRIIIDGSGYNYSGARSVPRAAFQFNKGADNCLVEGFEIRNCTNDTFNGAAVRISKANKVTVRDCEVHHNDMGFMSDGDAKDELGKDVLIEDCHVHHNGNEAHAGYNHNFYMGGHSVTIRGCHIHDALTGHNVKSRAHLTTIDACYIHDSANRELDLVDAGGDTDRKGSHALVAGCTLVKKLNMAGNKAVIHFGQDGGNEHQGSLYLMFCTIITPYVSPVIDISCAEAGARIENCFVIDPTGKQNNQVLVRTPGKFDAEKVSGAWMWVSWGFELPNGNAFSGVTTGKRGSVPRFVDPAAGDYTLRFRARTVTDAGRTIPDDELPEVFRGRLMREFKPPIGSILRRFEGTPDLGSFEWHKF